MSSKQLSVSTELMAILLRYAARIGVDIDAACEAAGVSKAEMFAPGNRVPVEQLYAVWREIIQAADGSNFGLGFGQAMYQLANNHLLFVVVMNASDVGAALTKMLQYHDLMTDVIQLKLIQQEDRVYLRSRSPTAADPILRRHQTETTLSMVASALSQLTMGRIELLETRFAHPMPEDTQEHQRIFGSRLAFSQPYDELVLARDILSEPVFLANPAVFERLDHLAQESLARLTKTGSVSYRVAEILSEALLRGERPMIRQVASRLAISARHLQRKLQDEKTSYRRLLDAAQMNIATTYLQRAEVNLCEIAFLLGFSDQSAFDHAFKRWTHQTPSEYHRRMNKT